MAEEQELGELGQALQRLVYRLSRELRARSAGGGVSGADALSLYEVRRRPGIGVTELAGIEKVNRSVMSERVARLETAGLVERLTDPAGDRRRFGLQISPKGREFLLQVSRQRRDWMAERLTTLTADERGAVHLAVRSLERLLRDAPDAKPNENDEREKSQ
ncbi:MarR family winged helix-turn-helix transcriptional regulator [Phenylobacterium sp.]|jgi:DNA-binding MarR family transcriptional regulator|uniref:MarR family winged helix-turn-helix transcriptional regulator n=1 Tax=Phenylobacterium sp. TaxID=1871053 RepID=UPI002E36D4FA|nr:MarR family transcriptional regulator [Phenylobacterium sp.]HEX2560491.1 MarR family transcriptional regulator [Phenylobacterium sp.]